MTTSTPSAAVRLSVPVRAAEEWNEDDFDFDDARSSGLDALRPPSSASHAESESSDAVVQRAQGLGITALAINKHTDEEEADCDRELNDDDDDGQVDTIKVSALAGETLSQLAAAGAAARASSSGGFMGSVTHLHAPVTSRSVVDAADDWDEDLEMPELLSSASLLRRPASLGSVELDFDTPSLDEHSDATSGSAEPSRRTRIGGGGVGASTRHHGSSSSSASSLLSPPRPSAKTMGSMRKGTLDFARVAHGDDEDLESAFDLAPQLERLVLSPAIARQRSHPTLEQQSLLWGDEAGKRSSSPESGAELGNLRRSMRGAPTGSGASVSAPESDADDEEDMLDGLELPEGLFGAAASDVVAKENATGQASWLYAPTSARLKLQAMLDARKIGMVSSNSGEVDAPLSPTASDADFTAGLVITDDLDLSPSRLHAKSLSFKMRPGFTTQRTRVTAQPVVRRAMTAGLVEGVLPRRRNATPIAPALTITGSSPQQPQTRTVPHLQQAAVRSSPPRAFSSHAHEPGLGPRGSGPALRSVERTLRFKKSVGDLLAAANASGAGQSGAAGSSAARSRTLVRKRSLPHLGDSVPPSQTSPLPESTHSSTRAVFEPPTQPRLFASTAASRARAAEAQAKRLGSPSSIDVPLPPARPCTPTTFVAPTRVGNGGAGRFTMPTTASRARQADAVQTLVTARPSSPLVAASTQKRETAVRMLRRPKRGRSYGDGHELESFDDLPTNKEREARMSTGSNTSASTSAVAGPSTPKAAARGTTVKDDTLRAKGTNVLAALTSRWSEVPTAPAAMRKRPIPSTPTSQVGSSPASVAPSTTPSASARRRKRGRNSKDPTLIRNLGGSGAAPRVGVVGDMRWNAARQRWEGNEGVLRDFENALSSSSRPALITPLSASTSGLLPSPTSPNPPAAPGKSGVAQPLGLAMQPGARVVGDMIFDPESMKWVHAQGEEEPDPFAEMQEEDETAEERAVLSSSEPGGENVPSHSTRRLQSSDLLRVQAALADHADAMGERRTRTSSGSAVSSASIEGAMERGAREPPPELRMSSMVSPQLWRATMQAGARHEEEIKAFLPTRPGATVRNPREHLYLLQRIARQAAR